MSSPQAVLGHQAPSPVTALRRLALELRRLREQTGQLSDAVAKALYWSPSKISRYEWGRTLPVVSEVDKLLAYYGVTGTRFEDLHRLAQAAHKASWVDAYYGLVPASEREFIGLEQDAADILIWQQVTVPALLQTGSYALHLADSNGRIEQRPPRQASKRAAVSLQRQQLLLARTPPPRITVVLDESLLRRPTGGVEVMSGQLRELVRLARHPAITVHVLPLTCPQPVFTGAFTLLGSSDDLLADVVALDHFGDDCLVEDEQQTYLYRVIFERLTTAALDPQDSLALLHQLSSGLGRRLTSATGS
jgi:transcriptional regulator with XRE-family HTH domain